MANTTDQEQEPTKQEYLSRKLLKEKVVCPTCQVTISLRQLRFRHRCKNSKPVDVEARKATMLERAVKAHLARQAEASEPLEP